MTIEAWYMDTSDEDQRLPHKTDPVEIVSLSHLAGLGVLTWSGISVLPPLDDELSDNSEFRVPRMSVSIRL